MAVEAMVTKLVLDGQAGFSSGMDRAAQSVDKYDKHVDKAHRSTLTNCLEEIKAMMLHVKGT